MIHTYDVDDAKNGGREYCGDDVENSEYWVGWLVVTTTSLVM